MKDLKNQVAEHVLLGSCIENPKILDAVIDKLAPESFSDPRMSAIYSAMCSLTLGEELNAQSLVEELRDSEMLETIGGDKVITYLTTRATEITEAIHSASIIVELAGKREQYKAAIQYAEAITSGQDPSDYLSKLNLSEIAADGFIDLGMVLTKVISGEHKKLMPTILQRSDFEFLIYPGRYSTVYGPPESAKSWLLAASILQLAQTNQVSIYVDAEDDAITFIERMVALCLGNDISLETLASWIGDNESTKMIFYRQDNSGLNTKTRAQIVRLIKQKQAKLVVLDGFNAMLSAAKADENSSSDVARFISGHISPLVAASNSAVVTIDHVVKSAGVGQTHSRMGARGSGHKIAAVSGVALRSEVIVPGSAFSGGEYKIWCEKDRPGRLKVSKQGSGRLAAVMVTNPMIDLEGRETTTVKLKSPDEVIAEMSEKRWDLICAETISRMLEEAGKEMTKTEIRDTLKEEGKNYHTTTTVAAFKHLIETSYVRVEKDGRTERITHLVPYKASYGDIPAGQAEEENPF